MRLLLVHLHSYLITNHEVIFSANAEDNELH